eukprot:53663-Amorphochlora_amoeboformis.AAC.1
MTKLAIPERVERIEELRVDNHTQNSTRCRQTSVRITIRVRVGVRNRSPLSECMKIVVRIKSMWGWARARARAVELGIKMNVRFVSMP